MQVYLCSYCLNLIDKLDVDALELFELISQFFIANNFLELPTEDPEGNFDDFLRICALLEANQLVISTEISLDKILIKPRGFNFVEDDDGNVIAIFCIKKIPIDCIDAKSIEPL
jgi:hypothetical protein